MTWTTPTTASTGTEIRYTRWVDHVLANVQELAYRKAGGFGSILLAASTSAAAENTPLGREMRAVELGGQEDHTTLDTVAAQTVHPFGGGPGEQFTVPRGMTGLWRFVVAGGSTTSANCTVQVMWQVDAVTGSTSHPAGSSSPAAWTYQWCVAASPIYPNGYDIEPSGVIVDRFSSGDKVSFYTVAVLPSGSTVSLTHGAKNGYKARVWACFLGTTV